MLCMYVCLHMDMQSLPQDGKSPGTQCVCVFECKTSQFWADDKCLSIRLDGIVRMAFPEGRAAVPARWHGCGHSRICRESIWRPACRFGRSPRQQTQPCHKKCTCVCVCVYNFEIRTNTAQVLPQHEGNHSVGAPFHVQWWAFSFFGIGVGVLKLVIYGFTDMVGCFVPFRAIFLPRGLNLLKLSCGVWCSWASRQGISFFDFSSFAEFPLPSQCGSHDTLEGRSLSGGRSAAASCGLPCCVSFWLCPNSEGPWDSCLLSILSNQNMVHKLSFCDLSWDIHCLSLWCLILSAVTWSCCWLRSTAKDLLRAVLRAFMGATSSYTWRSLNSVRFMERREGKGETVFTQHKHVLYGGQVRCI